MQVSSPSVCPEVPERPEKRWLRLFGAPPPEHGFVPLEVEGAIPEGLAVTAYFNGPGHFHSAGRPYGHWFDGDGTVAAVRIGDGRAEGAYRTIETRHRAIEAFTGRHLFGAFGTGSAWPLTFVPPLSRIKASANTAILCHASKVYALMEGTKPMELDPDTLEARGLSDLGLRGLRNFSAHPCRVGDDRLISTSVRLSRRDHVDLLETRSGRTRRLVEIPIPHATMVHSFAVTEGYAVLVLTPWHLDKLRFVLNLGAFADNMRWRPERGTEVVLVPLDAPERFRRISVEPFFFFHVAHAFEAGGEVHVDLVRYPDAEVIEWLGAVPNGARPPIDGGRMTRLSLDPGSLATRLERLSDALVEFPMTSPAFGGEEATWMICGSDKSGRLSGPVDSLLRLDVTTGQARPVEVGADEAYPSEVLIVPRSERPDDAWLLSVVYDPATERSYVAILDAEAVNAGPLAKLHFDHHIPPRFHGDLVVR